ncbi:MAG: hypothetical protein KDJ52_14475 [Anaerolineae bacterium]|nr:hypothetical protein [Anaerolineae bacterium]
MSQQRPWWLWASKSHKLSTTVREESTVTGPVYIIRGEPIIQGLTWLVWGPLSALAVIIILTGLAIVFEAKEQTLLVRALFILAFLGLPAVAWGLTIVLVNRLSNKYLQAEREADAQECRIQLDSKRGQLHFSKNDTSSEMTLPFSQIHQVNVAEPIGVRGENAVCLALDTEQGKIILLNENLGTEAQKFDLAREIQNSLRQYATTVRQTGDGHLL